MTDDHLFRFGAPAERLDPKLRLPRRSDPRRPAPKQDFHGKSQIGKRSRKLRRTRRKRCDASVKGSLVVSAEGNVRTRHPRCRAWALAGKNRCRMHGGASTGPKTPEGKARVVAAMVAGRRKWVERMKAEGKKFPCGPRPKAPATPKSSEAWDGFNSTRQADNEHRLVQARSRAGRDLS